MKATFLNGVLYQGEDSENAPLSTSDRGFLLGDGLFETLPIIQGTALWWEDHKSRLIASAALLEIPLQLEQIEEAVCRLCALSQNENSILRIAISRGCGGRGLLPPSTPSPTLVATLAPLPEGLAFQDVTLATSTIRRNEHAITSTIKSSNYLDNILSARQAEKAGAGDALLLNTASKVAGTTIGNIFAIDGNKLITPPVSDGLLPGIMRAQLLKLAPQWGFEMIEASLTYSELNKADGLFMTNSLRFIRRITKLDDHQFAYDKDDHIQQLKTHLANLIGKLTGSRS
nr:aminodeoxychorismate lyase [uncultured Cohaesibacter sp.]